MTYTEMKNKTKFQQRLDEMQLKKRDLNRIDELVLRYGFTDLKAEEFVKIHKLLNDTHGIMDGRTLHEILEVAQRFDLWIKAQLERVGAIQVGYYELYNHDTHITDENKFYSEFFKEHARNSEFFKKHAPFTQDEMKNMSSQQRSAYGITTEYTLTNETAKHICMAIGFAPNTNVNTKEISNSIRDYFIIAEKLAFQEDRWVCTRQDARALKIKMDNAYIKAYKQQFGKVPTDYDMATVQNNVYKVVFGDDATASNLKKYLGVTEDEPVLNWVQQRHNEAICFVYSKFTSYFKIGQLDASIYVEIAIDEFDDEFGIKKISDDEYIVEGTLPIQEINREINLELDEENPDYDTIAGLIITNLDQFPKVGDKVQVENLIFTVEEKNKLKITRIRIKILPVPEEVE